MNILYSAVAGVIQGLTEFLPVSSSGHLVIFHDLLGFEFVDNLAFDAILHLGTLVALVAFFWPDLRRYFIAFCQSLIKRDLKNNKDQLLAWYILIATVPAAIAGLLFEKEIETLFRQPLSIAWAMIIIGIFLYLADVFSAKNREISQLSFGSSLVIGFFQALSLIPGVSRSGITIIAGLGRKLKREEAARFSFLLATPIVLAAGLKKVADLFTHQSVGGADSVSLLLGFLISACTGYFCIKYFLQFLQSHSLKIFAYYRIIFGVIVLIYLMIR